MEVEIIIGAIAVIITIVVSVLGAGWFLLKKAGIIGGVQKLQDALEEENRKRESRRIDKLEEKLTDEIRRLEDKIYKIR
jgi:hypothetical protein